jgi:dTDP-4-dehydrorhamnose 3,5-epimerase
VIFSKTPLEGAFVIEIEPILDRRGFFARSFDANEFRALGMRTQVAQCNVSYNTRKGTLRGMHMQLAPASEPKLVRCTAGGIYDVIIDMRVQSPTYLQHFGVELSAANRRQLYVPELFAHGYLTLCDDAEVCYQVGEFYTPSREAGLRWDDPVLGIRWPAAVQVLSEKDGAWPLLPAAADKTSA